MSVCPSVRRSHELNSCLRAVFDQNFDKYDHLNFKYEHEYKYEHKRERIYCRNSVRLLFLILDHSGKERGENASPFAFGSSFSEVVKTGKEAKICSKQKQKGKPRLHAAFFFRQPPLRHHHCACGLGKLAGGKKKGGEVDDNGGRGNHDDFTERPWELSRGRENSHSGDNGGGSDKRGRQRRHCLRRPGRS